MVSKTDAGPIIVQAREEINEDETATTLFPKTFSIGTQCLIEALPKILSGIITLNMATPKDESQVINAAMIPSAEV